MLKIQCPDCKKSFMWTDNMPLAGKCPTDDCNWRYNVHGEVGKSVEKRIMERDNLVPCPHCGKAIANRLTVCEYCGEVIVGEKFVSKRYLLFAAVIILLLIISILIKHFS